MSAAWISHVKTYAAKNKVSYKDALKGAGATYTKTSKPKESKAHEAGEAKMPAKRKKKEEKKEEMPEILGKAEKKDKLVMKRDEKKRVEAAEAKGKTKKTPVLM